MSLAEPPVRVCCFQRHYGVQCPDGKVMCCLCFSRFDVDQLSEENDQKIDVCLSCADQERIMLENRSPGV